MINKRKKSGIRYLLRILGIQFLSTPFYTVFIIIIILLEAIGLTARTVTTESLFDTIIDASKGNVVFNVCLIPILTMGIVTLLQQAMNGIKFFLWDVITEKSSGKNNRKLFRKLQRISPELFENPEFLDDLNKAKEGVKPITYVALNMLNIVFFDVTYAITMGGYLFTLCPMLIFTLVLALIPAIISQSVRIRAFSKLEEESAPIRRENEYYSKVICEREYFKETRILGAFDYFYKLFCYTFDILIKKQWKIEKKTTCVEIFLNFFTFVGMGVSILLLFFSTMNGSISVAAFAAVFSSLSTIFDIMQSMMNWDVTCISNDIGKVINYINVMEYKEVCGIRGEKDFSQNIVVNSVSFKYPLSDTKTIDDISLIIKNDETVAIVGENGSGKSTLIRMLTGIYKPTSGSIKTGGLDTCKYNKESLYSNVSGVFQNFQKYKLSLKENVIISDLDRDNITDSDINSAINKSGFEYNNKMNFDTILSPEFGGLDLSGGQWQRIAIARGIYRNNDFIVLDEPTAAIAPIEEDKIFTKFTHLVKGTFSVIVTHRLASTRLVDKIIVLDKGRIVDIGTHDELISRPGKYAELWNAQAEWYEREM